MKLARKNQLKIALTGFFLITKKVPVGLFVALALLGAFIFGFITAYGAAFETELPVPTEIQNMQIQKDNYFELIMGYETLSEMYNRQGDNIATILSKDAIYTNWQAVYNALSQIDKTRDTILVQLGKIQQLRKAAGFPETNLQQSN